MHRKTPSQDTKELRHRGGGGGSRLRPKKNRNNNNKSIYRNDALGSHGRALVHKKAVNFESLSYVADESDTWRARNSQDHFVHRGEFWNAGKHATLWNYVLITLIGVIQACVAYSTNISSKWFIEVCM